jgi:hypothetical protein
LVVVASTRKQTSSTVLPCSFTAAFTDWVNYGNGTQLCPRLGSTMSCSIDADCAAVPWSCVPGDPKYLSCVTPTLLPNGTQNGNRSYKVCGYVAESMPPDLSYPAGVCDTSLQYGQCALCVGNPCWSVAFCASVSDCKSKKNLRCFPGGNSVEL